MNPFRKILVQMQVITSALTAGLVVMVIVVITIVTVMGRGIAANVKFVAPNVPMVTAVMGGISLALLVLAALLPEVIERWLVRRAARGMRLSADGLPAWEEIDPSWAERADAHGLFQLIQVLHTKTVLRAGLLLALGMLAGMAYLVETHEASLFFMGVSLLWLVWSIPTRGTVSAWLGGRVERLKFEPGRVE